MGSLLRGPAPMRERSVSGARSGGLVDVVVVLWALRGCALCALAFAPANTASVAQIAVLTTSSDFVMTVPSIVVQLRGGDVSR
jgi:hypothetical protein